MNGRRLRIAVLISGTGSNLKALIDAQASGRLAVDFARVISNQPAAGGLQHASAVGIPCSVFPSADAPSREALDRAIGDCLEAENPDLIVLAGYMRILGADLVRRFAGRIINLHPSLLPLYPGLDTYRRAIESGDREHGSSMHFVTEGLDDGPLIAQTRIPIRPDDTPGALASRLGPEEHRLIVATVELFTRHAVEQVPDGVRIDGVPLKRPLLLNADDELV